MPRLNTSNTIAMLGTLALLWLSPAAAQVQDIRSLIGPLAKAASAFEETCHASQETRLKELPESASRVQRLQLEVTNEEVCPCIARKMLEVKDVELAKRLIAKDPQLDATFFEPTYQECAVAIARKLPVASCEEEASVPGAEVTLAACRCFSTEIAKLDDEAVRDDAIATFLNYQERAKDPAVKPYASRILALQQACAKKNPP